LTAKQAHQVLDAQTIKVAAFYKGSASTADANLLVVQRLRAVTTNYKASQKTGSYKFFGNAKVIG
jgi:hypothetical protein